MQFTQLPDKLPRFPCLENPWFIQAYGQESLVGGGPQMEVQVTPFINQLIRETSSDLKIIAQSHQAPFRFRTFAK